MRVIVTSIATVALLGCVTYPAPLRSVAAPALTGKAGVYASPGDFEAQRLAHERRCTSATEPIDYDTYARAQILDVRDPDSSVARRIAARSAVFGFRTCDGGEFRFVGPETYRIIRALPLYLYERYRAVWLGRRSRMVPEHFFSVAAGDSIRPLTRVALKQAYPGNHRFADLIDSAFKRDLDLVAYDDLYHEYQVARLLRGTLPLP